MNVMNMIDIIFLFLFIPFSTIINYYFGSSNTKIDVLKITRREKLKQINKNLK